MALGRGSWRGVSNPIPSLPFFIKILIPVINFSKLPFQFLKTPRSSNKSKNLYTWRKSDILCVRHVRWTWTRHIGHAARPWVWFFLCHGLFFVGRLITFWIFLMIFAICTVVKFFSIKSYSNLMFCFPLPLAKSQSQYNKSHFPVNKKGTES